MAISIVIAVAIVIAVYNVIIAQDQMQMQNDATSLRLVLVEPSGARNVIGSSNLAPKNLQPDLRSPTHLHPPFTTPPTHAAKSKSIQQQVFASGHPPNY
jgi:hypothetical protein